GAEERCQRLESRAEAAEKEVEVTRRQVEEFRQRVKDLKLELSSLSQHVDRKTAELASVMIERDELSYKLEAANEKLSSATEQMGILKAAVEQESSQRQLLTLQHHGLREECDRLQSTVEKLDQINTENMLAEKRVLEYGDISGDRISTVASLGRSQRHVIDYARQMVTMSLEDYNAEAARVAELTDQLSAERRQLERHLEEVRRLTAEKERLRAALQSRPDSYGDQAAVGDARPSVLVKSGGESTAERPAAGRITSALPKPKISVHASKLWITSHSPERRGDPAGADTNRARPLPIPHDPHKMSSVSLLETRPLLPPNLGSPSPSSSVLSDHHDRHFSRTVN
ncbi:hypothetical protein FOZ62_030384, partial [Perkinsus olseni]